jgi:hypothetical protein
VNIPLPAPFDFEIGAKKIEDRPAAFVGDVVAKVVLPGTSEPEVVQTIGEVGAATVIPARDPNPQPAEAGSWQPSEEHTQQQALEGHAKGFSSSQLWSKVKASPKSKPSKGPEVF